MKILLYFTLLTILSCFKEQEDTQLPMVKNQPLYLKDIHECDPAFVTDKHAKFILTRSNVEVLKNKKRLLRRNVPEKQKKNVSYDNFSGFKCNLTRHPSGTISIDYRNIDYYDWVYEVHKKGHRPLGGSGTDVEFQMNIEEGKFKFRGYQ